MKEVQITEENDSRKDEEEDRGARVEDLNHARPN